MVKVQLPKVEEETRTELNIIKARRKDKSLDETLNYLIDSEKQHYSPENISIIVKAGTLDKLKNYDIDGNSSWDKLLNRMMDELEKKELMKSILADFQDAGILGDGVVNYEVKYGLANCEKVEEETRTELNIIKARRKDKSLDETLNYLIDSEKQHYSQS